MRAVAVVALALGLVSCGGGAKTAARRPARPVYFFANAGVEQGFRQKPSEIVFAADGNDDAQGLVWHHWGSATATGEGTMDINDCRPSCGQGTRTPHEVIVVLTHIWVYRGRRMYRCYAAFTPGRAASSLAYCS